MPRRSVFGASWRCGRAGAPGTGREALPASGHAAGDTTDYTLAVDTARTGARIDDTMYGVFFEDINRAADGGLYAELVQNRSFEYGPARTATPTR